MMAMMVIIISVKLMTAVVITMNNSDSKMTMKIITMNNDSKMTMKIIMINITTIIIIIIIVIIIIIIIIAKITIYNTYDNINNNYKLHVGDLEVSPDVIAQLPVGYLPVSVKSGQNVVVLRESIERMLLDLEDMLQQRQERKEAEAEAEAEK